MRQTDQQAEQSPSPPLPPKPAWHQRKWTRRSFYAVLSAFAIWLYYFKPPVWYEEVQLSDGSFITIKQRLHDIQTFSSGIGSGGGWYANQYQIDANEKLGIKTPWIGLYGMPLVLDKNKEGQWVVISTFVMCEKFGEFVRWRIGPNWESLLSPEDKKLREFHRQAGGAPTYIYKSFRPYVPKQFYLEYRYINDQSVLQPEVDPQHDGRKSNLLIGVSSHFDRPYFSVKGKQEREESTLSAKQFQNILFSYRNKCGHGH